VILGPKIKGYQAGYATVRSAKSCTRSFLSLNKD
jgi:hypothetical protein